jgi:hypothetical protein
MSTFYIAQTARHCWRSHGWPRPWGPMRLGLIGIEGFEFGHADRLLFQTDRQKHQAGGCIDLLPRRMSQDFDRGNFIKLKDCSRGRIGWPAGTDVVFTWLCKNDAKPPACAPRRRTWDSLMIDDKTPLIMNDRSTSRTHAWIATHLHRRSLSLHC